MTTDDSVSIRLKEERERLGLSQQEIAKYAGVRREMWAKYEAGAEPGAKVLSGVVAAGIDVLYVLTGERMDAVTPNEKTLLKLYRENPLALRDAALRVLEPKKGLPQYHENIRGPEYYKLSE